MESTPVLAPTPENLDALARGKLRLRQQPGPDNALGLVKFMLPNPYNVYLHSTPAQALFERSTRAFRPAAACGWSNPVGLAAVFLREDPTWTREKILQAMNGTRPTQVNLKQPPCAVFHQWVRHGNRERKRGRDVFLPGHLRAR